MYAPQHPICEQQLNIYDYIQMVDNIKCLSVFLYIVLMLNSSLIIYMQIVDEQLIMIYNTRVA